VHKRLDLLVHTGKQSAHTRKTELACDARMVAHTVVITCSEWITHTVMLCAQYACVHTVVLCYFHVISCVKRGKFVWHDSTWG
jgi:hypothetical protein